MSEKVSILNDNGEKVEAMAPVVVSASRATDIPAFYADWFFERLNKGYSVWTNPFNGKPSYVSYQNTRFIVFWSKNPKPLLKHLDELKQRGIGCYVQYTLNDYDEEQLERGVPPLEQRINTFRHLVEQLGVGAVVWRFDPLILTDRIDMDKLLEKITRIGDELKGYTEKLVFSFADIVSYRKVQSNLKRNGINYIDWTKDQMVEFARRLVELNRSKGWNYILATCAEGMDLEGVEHNHCVDDRLMVRFGHHSPELMKFLGAELINVEYPDNVFAALEDIRVPEGAIRINDNIYAVIHNNNRDKGQRIACGCMKSKDIGEYNTCPHLCEYCYANSSKELALANWQLHKSNPSQESITGGKKFD